MKLRILSLFLCSLFARAGWGESGPVQGLVSNYLAQPYAAADFTLTDQHDLPFHMAGTRGKVALLCFIYTHCSDFCPFIALKVKEAYRLLGADAVDVALVAVTTDPERDVPRVTAEYSRELGMFDVWHFVGGPPSAVHAVWADYGIDVVVDPRTGAASAQAKDGETASAGTGDEPVQGLTASDFETAGKLIQEFGGGYDVGHSAPFLIVDREGQVRVRMDAYASPEDLVQNVRVLLKLR